MSQVCKCHTIPIPINIYIVPEIKYLKLMHNQLSSLLELIKPKVGILQKANKFGCSENKKIQLPKKIKDMMSKMQAKCLFVFLKSFIIDMLSIE